MRSICELRPSQLVLLLGLTLALGCARAPAAESTLPEAAPPKVDAKRGIVSVVVTAQDPDFGDPWAKKRPAKRRIVGLVVPGRRILVHGRRLAHRTLVMVQKLGRAKRYQAKVVEVDYEVPLGLLTVDDPSFWEDLEPLPIADRVPVEGDATINRWRTSGQFESARAVVTQLRVASHFPGDVDFLTLELTSSISGGGWGEVVMAGGKVVGLTTSSSDDQVTVLAAQVLMQFLGQVEGGKYKGFARKGFAWQQLGNPPLRAKLGLKSGQGGIRIRQVKPFGSAKGVLQPDDVLLEIGGYGVDERGKIDHPEYGKLFFGVVFTDGVTPGERLPVKVLRKGKVKKLEMTLRATKPEEELTPRYTYDQAPEFVEVGGLVFQTVTVDYLRQWRSWWQNAPLPLLVTKDLRGRKASGHQERLVLLSKVLPDPVNVGYHDLRAVLVDKINGRHILGLDDVRAALKAPKDGFHIVEMKPGQRSLRVVLDAKEAKASQARIHGRYGLAPRRGR